MGIYRAKTDADRKRRETFIEELFQAVAVHPLTLEVARLAGRIHGERAGERGSIDFPDLTIGATALHLGFAVLTLNVRLPDDPRPVSDAALVWSDPQ